MNERIKWIDLSKVIGIWLVVFGHMQLGNAVLLTNIIYTFHMPLFFFISGYLAKPRTIKETLKKNIITILIPYIAYYLISYFGWLLISYMRHSELYNHNQPIREAIVKPFFGMLFGVGYNTSYSTMVNVPLWFLMGLFFVTLLFSIIEKSKTDIEKIAYTIMAAAIGYVFSLKQIDLLFSIDSALMAFPFYGIGYYAKNSCKRAKINAAFQENKSAKLLLLSAISGVIVFITTVYNGRVDINGMVYGKNPILFYFDGMVGIIGIIAICKLVSKLHNEIVVQIANGTILIMGFHSIINGIVLYPIKNIQNKYEIGIKIIAAIIVIIICIPIINIAKNRFPVLLGNRTSAST